MLYDSSADVIRKALRGLAMAPSEAAAMAGLPERDVIRASRGEVPRDVLAALAPALGLGRDALAELSAYAPPQRLPGSISRLELPFDDETVNAWLVFNGAGGHVLIDTGDGPKDVRTELEARNIGDIEVFITHRHGDHTGGLAGLTDMIRSQHEPGDMKAGDHCQCGNLALRAIDLPGHCPGALGYLIEGLEVPVCATGDALFAGSMGGCAPGAPYQAALEALRSRIMSLPDDCVLLPGHGPATTVGSERSGNPFLTA
ncbi:MBL fold metallo-hydrolase [Luteolibacter marinus]|uniref:MBL fold metallo-hydrolase n=1 Tax=Luteolibacter marinus TaxID=2776705 RepID=UPI0018673AC6|nr:MBL fold metallo-hydrolase [Luteolibacter marinus]